MYNDNDKLSRTTAAQKQAEHSHSRVFVTRRRGCCQELMDEAPTVSFSLPKKVSQPMMRTAEIFTHVLLNVKSFWDFLNKLSS